MKLSIFGLANESGKALLELALVAPLIIGIALPSFDAVNFNRAGHILSAVTRESGRAAFACAYHIAPANQIRDCIATSVDQAIPPTILVDDGFGNFLPQANSGLGNIALSGQITITVWEWRDPLLGPPILISQYQRGGLVSRITPAQVQALNSYSALKRRIMTVETRVELDPISPFFQPERYLVMVI